MRTLILILTLAVCAVAQQPGELAPVPPEQSPAPIIQSDARAILKADNIALGAFVVTSAASFSSRSALGLIGTGIGVAVALPAVYPKSRKWVRIGLILSAAGLTGRAFALSR